MVLRNVTLSGLVTNTGRISSTLKMKAIFPSGTPVSIYQITRRHVPRYSFLHSKRIILVAIWLLIVPNDGISDCLNVRLT